MNITKTFCDFDFSKVSLANPVRMQGGSYYSKILLNDAQIFFVQTPKCKTKNGIIETGKRIYTDILLQQEQSDIIQFILDIETHIKKILQEKNNEWFENSMDDDDIEYFFNTNLKTYKQQSYLFRTFITNSRSLTHLHNIQIYDDTDEEKSFNDVKDKSIISIVHFKGVKFTSSSFHIDVELKQVMIINDEPIFSKRLIKPNVSLNEPYTPNTSETSEVTNDNMRSLEVNTTISSDNLEQNEIKLSDEHTSAFLINDVSNNMSNIDIELSLNKNSNVYKPVDNIDYIKDNNYVNHKNNEVENNANQNEHAEIENNDNQAENNANQNEHAEIENNDDEIENNDNEHENENTENITSYSRLDLEEHTNLSTIDSKHPQINDELREYTIDVSDSDSIKLKTPNEVYYEIYKKAKQKAKDSKKQAIIAYLEAKHIKNTYMLEDFDDSSSDEDFDNFSEMSYEDLE